MACAFAAPLALGKPLSSQPLTRSITRPRLAWVARRRNAARMAADEPAAANAVKEEVKSQATAEPVFEPPSLDTAIFSDFVDSAQAKIDGLQTQISEIDTEALTEDVKSVGTGLVDNAIAGDWLDRGELYGAVQLLFVVLLLRGPGYLDGVIGFFVGPCTLLAGAVISGKAMWDLGRKQISIWPAPVPGAELKTGGLYEYVRHPVYSGLILSALGYAGATASLERLALSLALTVFLAKKVEVEEDFLADAYTEYGAYQDEVKFKLIPGIW